MQTVSRRQLLESTAFGLAWIAAGAAGPAAGAKQSSGKAQKVDPKGKLAVSLKFTTDASTAPSSLRKPGSYCYNCQFFKGNKHTGWAPCKIFMGKRVHATRWCDSWSAQQKSATGGAS